MQKNKYLPFLKLAVYVFLPYNSITHAIVFWGYGLSALTAFAVGSLISALLFGITLAFAEKMLTQSVSSVLLFIFGGFMIRFIAVLGIGAFVYLKTDLSITAFFLGLFGSYIVLQILEIVFLRKRLTKQVEGAHERLDETKNGS